MKLLATIALFLTLAGTALATTFFDDGFEYASQGAFEAVWATSCPGISSLLGPSTEFAVSPTRSLRTFHNGGLSSCFTDRSFPVSTRVFYRMNFRMATGFDLETTCHPSGSCPGGDGSKLIYAKSVGAGYLIFAHILPGSHEVRLNAAHGGFTVVCPVSGVLDEECLFPPNKASVPLNPGSTYCIEMELQRNTPGLSDGIGRVWINGTLTLEYFNIAMANSTEGSSGFNDVTYYSQAGYGVRYLDDLAVGNTPIGCSGGGGPLPDTSPPNAPTNLNVTELWNDLKQFVARVWEWIGPSSVEAAVPNDKLALSWENAQVGVDYELRWQSFAHPDWIGLGFIPSSQLKLVVPIAPPITCQAGQDCYVCADARAKRLSDGVTGPWLSETPNGKACNQFSVGPIVLPPPPDPVPIPTVDTFKNILETDTKLSFQYAPVDCPKGITKATSTTKNGLRTVTLTCAK